jgi:hypothetical protein
MNVYAQASQIDQLKGIPAMLQASLTDAKSLVDGAKSDAYRKVFQSKLDRIVREVNQMFHEGNDGYIAFFGGIKYEFNVDNLTVIEM